MNVLQNLVTLYNRLPLDNTYRDVAQTILTHLDEMPDATMYDIADLCNASRTTIWRMVQKMGYVSFSDFHTALKVAIAQYHHYNRILPASACTDTKSIVASISGGIRRQAELIEQVLTPEHVDLLVELLHHAKRISMYFHYELSSTTPLSINLAMAGKSFGSFYLLPDILTDSAWMDEHSLILVSTLDFSETMDISPALHNAKDRGAVIFLENGNSKYRCYADYCFTDFFPNGENSVDLFSRYLLAASEAFRSKYLDDNLR